MFDQNFERLRLESGHSLAPDVRDAAWQQVRLYWRKLRHIAESVTDTEVKLNLPNQKTPKKRVFCIDGVVDIVREQGTVTMYDLKTHDLEFVQENIDLYRDQLNVYAYIWQSLRGERLDGTAVIATPLPDSVSVAMRSGNPAQIEAALNEWNPVVPITFDAGNVNKTIAEFAKVVDRIEDHEFQPPPLSELTKRDGTNRPFATRVCINCDMRFSCSSYREYARNNKGRGWNKIADFYDLEGDEAESIARFTATVPDDGDRSIVEDLD
jgi:hypothetical protein